MPSAQQGTAGANVYPWTRNGLGDVSLNGPATAGAATAFFWLELGELKRRIETAALALKNLPFQQKFGAAALTPGWTAGAPSLPPFTGQTQLTPPTSDTPKGIQITDVFAIYSVQTAALTAATLGISRTVYAENVAIAITAYLAATNIALTTTTAANTPHVQVVAVTTPVFETSDLSDIIIELSLTTAATSVVRVYGMGLHCNFNFD